MGAEDAEALTAAPHDAAATAFSAFGPLLDKLGKVGKGGFQAPGGGNTSLHAQPVKKLPVRLSNLPTRKTVLYENCRLLVCGGASGDGMLGPHAGKERL